MKWLYENWAKSTIFLAIYSLIFLFSYVLQKDFALFLIWLQLPVYFFHQFEEYIVPGGFVDYFNTKVLGSSRGDTPLNKKVSFWINIPIIYIAFPISAILAGSIDISIGIWTAYFSTINAMSHIIMAIKDKYNPGTIVSCLLNIPVGVFTIYYFISHHIITLSAHMSGLVIGLAVQGAVMIYGFAVLKPKITK